MAASDSHLLSFLENQGGIVVEEVPKLDLDLYIQNYKGRIRYDRLLLIGTTSAVLCVDALKAAVHEAKKGKDIIRYRRAVECLQGAAPAEPEAKLDQAWIETTDKSNKAENQRLENELKIYKNNLIKDSVRMGNEDLGIQSENVGDLGSAADYYNRMRQDSATSKQVTDVSKHLVRLAVQRRDWSTISANLNKIVGLQNVDEEKAIQPYLKVMHGIAHLGQKKYAEAALSFLQTDALTAPESYSEFVSPNDVATYGGLLALATMDRKDLQNKVLETQSFRTFLELEPQVRRAITQFVNGRYSACLAILESYRPDYLLDFFLQKHIEYIYGQIRSKCIVQYLKPFACVTLDSLNTAFAGPGSSIEDELAVMIQDGVLEARIDSIDKLVTTVSANPRVKMQISTLQTAKNYEKESLERIRRMGIVAADLEIKGVRKGPNAGASVQNFQEGSLEYGPQWSADY